MNRFGSFLLAFLLVTGVAAAKPPRSECKSDNDCAGPNAHCQDGKCVWKVSSSPEDGEQCRAGADCEDKCETKAYTYAFCCKPKGPGYWGVNKKGERIVCGKYGSTKPKEGRDGMDGFTPIVSEEPVGENCPAGGISVIDVNGNPHYVCNGEAGAPGGQGPQGIAGPAGSPAPVSIISHFGARISTGLDFVGADMISSTGLTFSWHNDSLVARVSGYLTADNEAGNRAIGWDVGAQIGAWLGVVDLSFALKSGTSSHAVVDHADEFLYGLGLGANFRPLWWSKADWMKEFLEIGVELYGVQAYKKGDTFDTADWLFLPRLQLGLQVGW